MLADWQSFNEIYGTTNNPWDETRAPGGSSGGSAVALATGMSALEIGSDIGASIRNPAHYCGVYGHKPTYGIVPMRGHFLPRLVLPGHFGRRTARPFGRRSGRALLKLLAGPEGIEAGATPTGCNRPVAAACLVFRVAVMLNDPVSEVDQPVQDLLASLAHFLEGRSRAFP